jgi:hypothetical protein
MSHSRAGGNPLYLKKKMDPACAAVTQKHSF